MPITRKVMGFESFTFFQFLNFCVSNISKTNEVRNFKPTPKVAHIIHMHVTCINLDWSTERTRREFCWTRDNDIQFFRDFDKENDVLYEF